MKKTTCILIFVMIFFKSFAYSAPYDADLILHWEFEETSGTTVSDSSSNNLDGMFHSDPFWDNDAATGNGALTFDGINDYVSIDSPSLDFGAEDFTVAIWVKKLESSGSGWDNVWAVNKWRSGPGSNNNEWGLSLTNGGDDRPSFEIATATTIYQVNGSQNLTVGQWHHIAGVRSGNEIRFYVDGQLEGSEYVGTASINNVGRDLRIANSALNALQTHGTFDDLRIYSRALTGSNIQDIMNGTTPEDTTPPVITLVGSTPVDIGQGSTYMDAGATAMDDVDGDVTVNIATVNPVDTNTIGTYIVTYNISDTAGNAALQVTRTVNVIVPPVDTTPPVITLLGSTPVDIGQGSTYMDAGATAVDNIDSTVPVTTSGSVDTATVGTYTITYTATDTAGNTATETRTVNVVEPPEGTVYEDAEDGNTVGWRVYDNNPAGAMINNVYNSDKASNVIQFSGSDTSNGYMLGGIEGTGAAWNNTEGKIIKWSMNYSEDFIIYIRIMTSNGARYIQYTPSNSDGGLVGSYIIIGLGSDSTNGTWQTFTRDLEADLQQYEPANELLAVNAFMIRGSGLVDDIELLSNEGPDTTPPVITLVGSTPVDIGQGSTYMDAGATAMDDVDGDVTVNIATVNPVDTNTIGTYIVTYNISDTAGNAALQVTRTVNVIVPPVDTTPPVITLLGSTSVYVLQGSTYMDAGATAMDDVDGDVTVNIVTNNQVDTNTIGVYTVTYTVSDTTGNTTTAIRTVMVGDGNFQIIELNELMADTPRTEDDFGYSVDIDGEYAIVGVRLKDVGAVRDVGAAYVFKKDTNGHYIRIAELNSEDGAEGDFFGNSVAIDGDYAVVGAMGEDSNNNNTSFDCGALYVFKKDALDNYTQIAKLVADDGAFHDHLGWVVDMNGDYIVSGADNAYSGSIEYAGAAYIFKKDEADNFTQLQKLTSGVPEWHAYFGYSVGISGEYVAVTAFLENPYDIRNAGSAYIFKNNGVDTFNEVAKLNALDLDEHDYFGRSISIDGDYVAVGAYYENPENIGDAGSAYVFKNDGSDNYNQISKLIAEDARVGDHLGLSIAIDGQYVVVGATHTDAGSITNIGSAYLFRNDGTDSYTQIAKINASSAQSNDHFGKAVSISGNDIIVGANSARPTTLPDDGSAYMYTISP